VVTPLACGNPGTDYFVDPLNGSDVTGNGSGALGDGGTAPGCAFKTITRAFQVLATGAAPGTRVVVLGPSTLDSSELYPLVVPANVVVTTRGGAVDLGQYAPTVDAFFQLAYPKSGIEGGPGAPLTVWWPANDAIAVTAGSDDTTFVKNTMIRGYTGIGTGIEVYEGARLSIGEGVVVQYGAIGLFVSGHADISVPAGHATTSFNGMTFIDLGNGPTDGGRGIVVEGSITIHGVPGTTPGTGTVVVNDNQGTGLKIDQSYLGSTEPNVIDGLVAHSNGVYYFNHGGFGFPGIFIGGGSTAKLRNSVVLGNAIGVTVGTAQAPTGTRLNGLDRIDLGVGTLADGGSDLGHNVLQAAPGADGNLGTGLCLEVDPGSGTLNAAGNVFSGPRDCAGSSPGSVTLGKFCTDGDVAIVESGVLPDGGVVPGDGGGLPSNHVDTSNCALGQ
jgi:hypothetical protein